MFRLERVLHMASISFKKKEGKILSAKFKTCVGRDEQGKQIFRCTTWTPPDGLTRAKLNRAAERAAYDWEDTVKAEYKKEIAAKETGKDYFLSPEQRHDDFTKFVSEVWMPLQVRSGTHKPSTVAFFEHISKPILDYFDGKILQEISPFDIQRYLSYLRTEYKGQRGKPLSSKSIRHHYGVLNQIFGYAYRHEMIRKNPMYRVEPPKKEKKPVDALTPEQAVQFFRALEKCPLEFHCILQLFITTGIRRGECMGLQWRDIDTRAGTIRIERGVSYTPSSGIVVNTPKTVNSIRTIPIMHSTAKLLEELKREYQNKYRQPSLETAFLFPHNSDPFAARDPNAVTRQVKKFMVSNGLPDLSPHDLRHSCATLMLEQGADIKSIQDILGHANASTTLNFYVRSDTKRMKAAADKLAAAYNL